MGVLSILEEESLFPKVFTLNTPSCQKHLHLTININIEASDQKDNNPENKQFVLTEENSSKLLNIVDNVLTQNWKS